jgi:hypothetical protein
MAETFTQLYKEIQRETEKLPQKCADEARGDLQVELMLWIRIAARREAMVRELYKEARQRCRLPGTKPKGAAKVAWQALDAVWNHEAEHTAFLKAKQTRGLFADPSLVERVKPLIGAMEGDFLDILTRSRNLARFVRVFALRLASWVNRDAAPPFTRQLTTLDSGAFFALCETLESTAVASYTHMLALAKRLQNQMAKENRSNLLLDDFAFKLALILGEEIWHESAFREIATWVKADGTFEDGLVDEACLERIKQKAPASLRPKVGDAPLGATRGPRAFVVSSDAGFGRLFKKYGLNFKVQPQPATVRGVQQSAPRARAIRVNKVEARAKPQLSGRKPQPRDRHAGRGAIRRDRAPRLLAQTR